MQAHLLWKGHSSPCILLMTGDPKLHQEAVHSLLEALESGEVCSGQGLCNVSGLRELQQLLSGAAAPGGGPVIPDVLQLAHAFAIASLLLLTGNACSFAATSYFPFIVELLEEDLWEDDPCREFHVNCLTSRERSVLDEHTSARWLKHFQCFLLKWWSRGAAAFNVTFEHKSNLKDSLEENEVFMLQVMAYLSPFVRSLGKRLQQSLVLQLCFNGNLNKAMILARRFRDTVGKNAHRHYTYVIFAAHST